MTDTPVPTGTNTPIEFPDMTDTANELFQSAGIQAEQLSVYAGKGSGKNGKITKKDAKRIVKELS